MDSLHTHKKSLTLKPRNPQSKTKVLRRFIDKKDLGTLKPKVFIDDKKTQELNVYSNAPSTKHVARAKLYKQDNQVYINDDLSVYTKSNKLKFKQDINNINDSNGNNNEHNVYAKANKANKAKLNNEIIDLKALTQEGLCVGLSHYLELIKITEQGGFLDGKEHGELFIPQSQLANKFQIHDKIRVFLYHDHNRVCATTRIPSLQLGMVGRLKVSAIVGHSAFMDMGIPKELIVPRGEQKERFIEGKEYTILIAQDDKGRLFGTQRFGKYIRNYCYDNEFTKGQKVKIVAIERTPLGYRVIVDDSVYGLIFESEQKGEIIKGKRYDGFVTLLRDNGKLDVSLQAQGLTGIQLAKHDILKAIYFSQGHLDFNDKTDPQEIENYLHMSKARFKKAIGALYKERYIVISEQGLDITLLGKDKIEQELKTS